MSEAAPTEWPPRQGWFTRAHAGVLGASAWVTVRLGAPAMAARAGIIVMMSVDTVMVGRSDAIELSYLGLSMPVQMMLMMTAVGILQGALVLTSQAFGAREFARCGATFRVSLVIALLIGLVFAVLAWNGKWFLLLFGQSADLAAGTEPVLHAFALGMPGMLGYLACAYFMEGIQRPTAALIVMSFANLLNLLLNGIVMAGWFGLFEPGGAEEAILATSIVRWSIFLAMLLVIVRLRERDAFGILRPLKEVTGTAGRIIAERIWRLGFPIALTQGIETAAFASLLLFAGLLGAEALAAYQVNATIIQLIYMFAIGTGAATAVRVGAGVGQGDPGAVRLAGWTGAAVVALAMTPFCLVMLIAPEWIASIFVDPGVVATIAAATIFATGCMMVIDGVMAVVLGALRGAGDVWIPLVLHIAAFWLGGVPAAYLFAFPLGLGTPGLVFGIMVGVVLSVACLGTRFVWISTRAIRRA